MSNPPYIYAKYDHDFTKCSFGDTSLRFCHTATSGETWLTCVHREIEGEGGREE